MSRFIEKSATAKVKKTFLAPILLSVLAAAAAVAFLFASEHSWVHGGLEEGVEPSAFQSAEAEDEIVREYLDFLNEFSGRRRLNVFFVNQQAAAYGLQLRYVNTGRGNLTYARRDISATGRLPLMAVRVYDSSLGEGSDLGLGWRLSAAETIEVGRDGSLTLTDESASRIRFLPDSRSGLYREAVLAPSPIEGILRESVGTLKVRMRSGLVKTFGRLGSPYRLTRVQDRHGNWIGLDYDEHSRLSAMRGSNGRSIRFQRNGAGRIAAAEDELGRRVEYIYDSQGRLSAAMDLGGNRWSYVYGQGGRLVQALDPLGMPLLEASYDEAGRVSALRTARSHFRYRYEGGRTLASDAHDATSVFTHNEDGVTVQVENSVGVISRVELDGAGEAERLWVDGRVTWEADNDLLGRPRTVRLHEPGQEIRRVQFTYDETGRVAASSQEGIRMRHDPLLRETSRTEDGEETLYGYNDQGDLSSLVLGDRHYRLGYNRDGNIVWLFDSRGGETRFEYQADGRLSRVLLADGSQHRFSYDDLGLRQLAEWDYGVAGTARVEYSYNPAGSVTEVRIENLDGSIRGNRILLDEAQRIEAIDYVAAGTIRLSYDEAGNLVAAQAGEEHMEFGYDPLGRLQQVRTVDGRILRHHYREGEPDLRLQADAKSGPGDAGFEVTGAAFGPGHSLLRDRILPSALGMVSFDPTAVVLRPTAASGVVLPEEAALRSLKRIRVLDLADGPDEVRRFEQPSNILFIPPEYSGLNCCVPCTGFTGPCTCHELGAFEPDPTIAPADDPGGEEGFTLPCEQCSPGPVNPPPDVSLLVESDKSDDVGTGFVVQAVGQTVVTNLTANVTPGGGTFQWSVGPKLSLVGSTTSQHASVRATAMSSQVDDTWVQVTYTVNGVSSSASARFTAKRGKKVVLFSNGGPGESTVQRDSLGRVIGHVTLLTYFPKDQFNRLFFWPGLSFTEVLQKIFTSEPVEMYPPYGEPLTSQTSLDGAAYDQLSVSGGGPISEGFLAQNDQSLSLAGFAFGIHQFQEFRQTYALVYFLVIQ